MLGIQAGAVHPGAAERLDFPDLAQIPGIIDGSFSAAR